MIFSPPRLRTMLLATSLLALTGTATAQDPNACDEPGDYPDLILGDLTAVTRWGTLDGITAYSVGSTSCNSGSCWVNWFFDTDQHPTFGENLFRLENGRFEQIGQAWVTHRFFALSSAFCETGCLPTNGSHLGVHCSTTESAPVTGGQQYKGPKSEVDAAAGSFAFPFTGSGMTGNLIYKRLQVHNVDLDPALHSGALYFLEGQNVSPDDAGAGMLHNNASWRQVVVAPGTFNLLFSGTTRREQPAIHAWAELDPEVQLEVGDVPDEGRFLVASKATPLGGGNWRYEYAIHNLNSHRSARSVTVPIPPGAIVSGIGFHDVDYHSGEPFDGTDWVGAVDGASSPNAVVWTTQAFAENPNANALRWGTLYNFRFDADAPPSSSTLVVGLFRPGTPGAISVAAIVPELCDGDASCETGETSCNCPVDCGAATANELACADGADDDCDGLTDCADGECCGVAPCPMDDADADGRLACEDCNDTDTAVWATPGEVVGLLVDRDAQDRALLSWSPPAAPGSLSWSYETLRSTEAGDFLAAGVCLNVANPAATAAVDPAIPLAGSAFHYLVRATNGCPIGTGPVGDASDGSTRPTLVCP